MNLQSLLRRNEFLVFLTIIALSIILTLINPSYISLANIFRMLRSSTELGIFALGVLVLAASSTLQVISIRAQLAQWETYDEGWSFDSAWLGGDPVTAETRPLADDRAADDVNDWFD